MDDFYGKLTVVGKGEREDPQDIVRELARIKSEFEGDGLADTPMYATRLPR